MINLITVKTINNMKTMNKFLSLLIIGSVFFLQSCGKDDDPVFENEEELITDVILTLTPNGGTEQVTLLFNDPDGEIGTTNPTIVGGTLQSGVTYTGEISLLNNSGENSEDVTVEVKEEGEEHLFCYTPTGVGVTITRTDNDGAGLELGIGTSWVVGQNTGTGTVRVTLKHQPGVKDGSCTPGDTDIEIDFPITIQ